MSAAFDHKPHEMMKITL